MCKLTFSLFADSLSAPTSYYLPFDPCLFARQRKTLIDIQLFIRDLQGPPERQTIHPLISSFLQCSNADLF